MTNGEVLNLFETLERISRNKDLKFKVGVGFLMAKNREILRPEAKIIYQLRQDIINEYATQQDNGDLLVPKLKIDEVNNKINELMGLQNDVRIWQISIEEFDGEGIELGLEDFNGLMHMLYIPEYTGKPIEEKQEQ